MSADPYEVRLPITNGLCWSLEATTITIIELCRFIKDRRLLSRAPKQELTADRMFDLVPNYIAHINEWHDSSGKIHYTPWIVVEVIKESLPYPVPGLINVAMNRFPCVLTSFKDKGAALAFVRIPVARSESEFEEIKAKLAQYFSQSLGGEIEWSDIEIRHSITVCRDQKLEIPRTFDVEEFNPKKGN